MAPVAALIRRRDPGRNRGDLIVCDTGGTTSTSGLVSGGEITSRAETWLGGAGSDTSPGIRRSTSSASAPAAAHRLGRPRRPAAGRARTAPARIPARLLRARRYATTVTDAAVVLGWIDPATSSAAGSARRDAARGRRESGRRPARDGCRGGGVRALTIATRTSSAAIREITIAQGIDPREARHVAGGGAWSNIVPIARELGCRRVLVPPTPARSPRAELSSPTSSRSSRRAATRRPLARPRRRERGAREVERRAGRFLNGLAGLTARGTRRTSWSRPAIAPRSGSSTCPSAPARSDEDVAPSRRRSTPRTSDSSPCASRASTWSACSGRCGQPRCSRPAAPPPRPRGRPATPGRTAYFRSRASTDVPLAGHVARGGTRVEGPAIIREPTTTIVVYPGRSAAIVTELGNYLLELAAESGTLGGLRRREPTPDERLRPRAPGRDREPPRLIVREMENTLLRTGRSAVLNMARDFSCALITADNRCSRRRRASRCT